MKKLGRLLFFAVTITGGSDYRAFPVINDFASGRRSKRGKEVNIESLFQNMSSFAYATCTPE